MAEVVATEIVEEAVEDMVAVAEMANVAVRRRAGLATGIAHLALPLCLLLARSASSARALALAVRAFLDNMFISAVLRCVFRAECGSTPAVFAFVSAGHASAPTHCLACRRWWKQRRFVRWRPIFWYEYACG